VNASDTSNAQDINEQGNEQAEDAAPEAPEDIAPQTLAERLEAVGDGSRTAEGTDILALAEELLADASSLRKAVERTTKARKKVAQRLAHLARVTLKTDGVPDWGLETRTAQTVIEATYDAAFADLSKEQRRKERQGVWAFLNRVYLELEIRDYVAAMTLMTADPTTGEPALRWPNGPDDTDTTFLATVRMQYKAGGLAVPTKYQNAEDKQNAGGNGSGPGRGPATTVEAALKGVDGLNQAYPYLASKGALKATSDLVRRLTDPKNGSNVDNRPDVISDLSRMFNLCGYAVAYLEGKATEKDREDVLTDFWGTEDTTTAAPATTN
jgi:hypothetical protein